MLPKIVGNSKVYESIPGRGSQSVKEPGPNSLAQIMARSGRLQALEQARQDRSTFTQTAKTWLSADLAAHLLAAALDPVGNLVLSFDSAAWATRARYAERDIISAANDPTVKAVKVRVHPPGGQPSNKRVGGDK